MLLQGNDLIKKFNHPGIKISKFPETFPHGKMCYGTFSKNSFENLTLIAARKPSERTLKLITGNTHFYTYLFPRAVVTNDYNLAGLKQQKCICPQFWRLDVRNQSVGSAMLLLKTLGNNPSLLSPSSRWFPGIAGTPWFVAASRQSQPLSSHHLLYVSLCLFFFCLL